MYICTNGLRPKRDHSEDCRRGLEGEIGKDSLDTRGEKVKERQDHFIAQQVEEHERVDPRSENEPIAEPEVADEVMSEIEEELTDAPASKTDVRLK